MGAPAVTARKPASTGAELLATLQPGVLLFPAFARLQGKDGRRLGVPAALLLSQAYYMARNRGGEWEYTPADWIDRTGLSDDQVTDGLRRLEAAGLLTRYRVGIRKRMRYSLELSQLARLLTSSVPVTGKSGYGKPENPVTDNRKIRLPVYKDPISKEIERGRNATRCARTRADASQESETLGTTWESWEAYARELSPAWLESGDARESWDDMEAVEWRDKSRRLVRDWKAKARRYLAAWRRAGGAAKEKSHSIRQAAAAGPAESETARKEYGRQRWEQLQALAAAGSWLEVVRVEAEWKAADSVQFEFYRIHKRPPSWQKHTVEAAARLKAA